MFVHAPHSATDPGMCIDPGHTCRNVPPARMCVAHYLAETKGQLLLFTSSSHTRGRAGYSLYSCTKAAVVNLTQALAEEWEPLGIRVNCIMPPLRLKSSRVKSCPP